MGESRWECIFPVLAYEQTAPDTPNHGGRHVSSCLAPKVRARTLDEVVTGMEAEEAWEEAGRCLRCDIKVPAGVS
jgi:hypothetical protein